MGNRQSASKSINFIRVWCARGFEPIKPLVFIEWSTLLGSMTGGKQ
jgi:hypothetical protein